MINLAYIAFVGQPGEWNVCRSSSACVAEHAVSISAKSGTLGGGHDTSWICIHWSNMGVGCRAAVTPSWHSTCCAAKSSSKHQQPWTNCTILLKLGSGMVVVEKSACVARYAVLFKAGGAVSTTNCKYDACVSRVTLSWCSTCCAARSGGEHK
jgi:hypothetical protein